MIEDLMFFLLVIEAIVGAFLVVPFGQDLKFMLLNWLDGQQWASYFKHLMNVLFSLLGIAFLCEYFKTCIAVQHLTQSPLAHSVCIHSLFSVLP